MLISLFKFTSICISSLFLSEMYACKGCGSECPSCYPSGPSKKNEVHRSNRSSCQNNFTDPWCTEGRTAHAHGSFCFKDIGTQAPSARRIAHSHSVNPCSSFLSLSRLTSRRWPRYAVTRTPAWAAGTLIAEAAKLALLGHSLEKVDKDRITGVAANLLHATSHYGKLEGKLHARPWVP
jgi:hypothetical protein